MVKIHDLKSFKLFTKTMSIGVNDEEAIRIGLDIVGNNILVCQNII